MPAKSCLWGVRKGKIYCGEVGVLHVIRKLMWLTVIENKWLRSCLGCEQGYRLEGSLLMHVEIKYQISRRNGKEKYNTASSHKKMAGAEARSLIYIQEGAERQHHKIRRETNLLFTPVAKVHFCISGTGCLRMEIK